MQDLGAHGDGSVKVRTAPVEVTLEDTGFVTFEVAGTAVSGEFRCADCGYGAVVHRALPPCPMCGGTVWETQAPRSAD